MLKDFSANLETSFTLRFILATDTHKEKLESTGVLILFQMMALEADSDDL